MIALVTGTSGFVGYHLAKKLVTKGWRIIGLDKETPSDEMKTQGVEFYQINLSDIKAMEDFFSSPNIRESIHTIFHLASETHVDYSYIRPFDFTMSNVLGTHVLLEMVRKYCPNMNTFLLFSTDENFGGSESIKTENDLCDASNPYSASKVAQEAFCNAYYHSYKIPLVTLRCNNIYGPFQTCDKLVAKAFSLALSNENKVFFVHGTGLARRSFIFVDDVVEATLFIANQGVKGEIYNVASRNEFTVLQVLADVNQVLKDHGKQPLELAFVDDRPYQDQRYLISGEKLKKLGFEPKTTWLEGLQETYNHYSAVPL